MQVPVIFFGPYARVKREMRKLITRVVRGESAASILQQVPLMDVDATPDALLWIDRAWSMLGGRPHFIMLALGEALFRDDRLTAAARRRTQDELTAYLSLSAWGTIALNGRPCFGWIADFPGMNRRGCAALLEGTSRFWDDYLALGRRFFAGGAHASTFPETLPLVGVVVANLGADPRLYADSVPHAPGGPTWGDIKRICVEHDLVRKVNDDGFWHEFAKSWASPQLEEGGA